MKNKIKNQSKYPESEIPRVLAYTFHQVRAAALCDVSMCDVSPRLTTTTHNQRLSKASPQKEKKRVFFRKTANRGLNMPSFEVFPLESRVK